MKTYTVHINPKAKNPVEDAEFVPEGYSVLMFIPLVNVIVAARRRCWLLLICMIMIEVVTYYASMNSLFTTTIAGKLQLYMAMRITLLFFFGLWVNDFWRKKLEKRGFEFAGIVSVRSTFHSLAEAEQRFYDKFVASKNKTI